MPLIFVGQWCNHAEIGLLDLGCNLGVGCVLVACLCLVAIYSILNI